MDNEPYGLVTNGRRENAVTVAQQAMRDRKYRSEQCMGAKVKIWSKMSWRLEAVSMVLFCIGQNVDILDLRWQPV